MTALPTLTLKVTVRNPEWVAQYDKPNRTAVNMDQYYIKDDRECEVLQLNLNAGTMRVRYQNPSKTAKKGFTIDTVDVSIAPFLEQYSITKR
jgi:hypothetical protein